MNPRVDVVLTYWKSGLIPFGVGWDVGWGVRLVTS